MLKIASLLLQNNAIPFDKEEFAFQIQSHPSYPSLHSITGVLDHFNIENVAAKVPVNNETLDQLPNCFIAQINSGNGLELILTEKKKDEYILYDSGKKKKKVSKETFLEIFTGIILAVEKDENIKPANNNRVFNYIFLTLLVFSSLFIFFQSTSSVTSYLLLSLSIIGILISISIVKQEFGIKNTIGDAFCSSNDEKKDCNAVLTSKGATIFKNYKLSDLSLIYFVGLSFSIFFLSIQNLSLNIVFLIGLISFPITIYSIYYQAIVVKKWCLLCLSIAGLLWISAALPFMFSNFTTSFQLIELLTVAISFLLFFNIWSYIKPKYTEALDNKKSKIDYYKFKRKYSLFSTLLKSNPSINTTIHNSKEIIFGNKDSNLEIVIITNPFCGHCKPVHKIIDDILHQYSNQVKIIIRFNINTEDLESDLSKITMNLLKIYLQKGPETCLTAMTEIYNKLSATKWLDKWQDLDLDTDLYLETFNKQKTWCSDNKINFTPEILINGYSFPKEYDRSDLSYFIEDLYEEYNIEIAENISTQEQVS